MHDDARIIGFIGSGEQAKMNLLALKTVRPSLSECRVSAKTAEEERQFIAQLAPVLPGMDLRAAGTDGAWAMSEADILVTATSAQAPILQAAWMKPGAFYSHIGGWEDDYAVAKQCDKIVCDDWETVKHRTQTLSRMYQDGELLDGDVTGDLVEFVAGDKVGRGERRQARVLQRGRARLRRRCDRIGDVSPSQRARQGTRARHAGDDAV